MAAGREEFISFINDRLVRIGFAGEDERWTLEQDIQNQARVVIVNGRRVEQPAESWRVKICIEVFGDGSVDGKEFVMLDFYAKKGEEPIEYLTATECLYFDDFDYFNMLLNHLFGL